MMKKYHTNLLGIRTWPASSSFVSLYQLEWWKPGLKRLPIMYDGLLLLKRVKMKTAWTYKMHSSCHAWISWWFTMRKGCYKKSFSLVTGRFMHLYFLDKGADIATSIFVHQEMQKTAPGWAPLLEDEAHIDSQGWEENLGSWSLILFAFRPGGA